MASYVAEVEDVEDDGDRSFLDQVGESDVFVEAATQFEEGSGGTHREWGLSGHKGITPPVADRC